MEMPDALTVVISSCCKRFQEIRRIASSAAGCNVRREQGREFESLTSFSLLGAVGVVVELDV